MKYPWGSSIDGSIANYKLSGDPFDDATTPVGYFNGKQEIVYRFNSLGGERQNPKDRTNAYGLYDVIGNVSEWCWIGMMKTGIIIRSLQARIPTDRAFPMEAPRG